MSPTSRSYQFRYGSASTPSIHLHDYTKRIPMDLKLTARKFLIASKHSTLKRLIAAGSTAAATLFAYLNKEIIPQEILFVILWLLSVILIELIVLVVKYFAYCETPLVRMERRFCDITGKKKSSGGSGINLPPEGILEAMTKPK